MKKITAMMLCLLMILSLAGCDRSKSGGDYPATINVNGINYYSTNAAVPVVEGR